MATVGAPPKTPDESRDHEYFIISYCTCVFAVVAFAAYAIVRYWMFRRKQARSETPDGFITARGTQSKWRIMYSFFSSAVGAWCLVSPSQFAVYNGIVTVATYAIASGLPVFILALFGNKIQSMHPDVVSISDFAGKRFGPVFRFVVVLICIFNMSIAMLAEYTVMGSLFQDFVGSVSYGIIILVGVTTMAYTSYGGTYISILTDQVQAILTILFIAILTIFVAVTFRDVELPKPLSPSLGANALGYSTIFSLPVSLMAATVFSEAMWQKVWAGKDRNAVLFGGFFGGCLIIIAVFLFGFAGWLANWGGLIPFDYDEAGVPLVNPNLFLFQVFKTADSNDLSFNYPAKVRSWIGVIALILAVTMNESAVDSLQSGITGTMTGHFFRNQHISLTRAIVVLMNIPLMIVATQGYAILSLFLITNMLTTACFLPVITGMFKTTNRYVSETCALFGCACGITLSTAYGAGRWRYATDYPALSKQYAQGYREFGSEMEAMKFGVYYTWFGNVNYDWDYFMVACCTSVGGMMLWSACCLIIKRFTGWEGPGITRLISGLPGFKFITGGGIDVDIVSKLTCGRVKYEGDALPQVDSKEMEMEDRDHATDSKLAKVYSSEAYDGDTKGSQDTEEIILAGKGHVDPRPV